MTGGGDYRTPSSAAVTVELGKPLEDGYLRVTNHTTPEGRHITVLVGHRWISAQRLREAAAILQTAADWLDTPVPPVDGQRSIYDELAGNGG